MYKLKRPGIAAFTHINICYFKVFHTIHGLGGASPELVGGRVHEPAWN